MQIQSFKNGHLMFLVISYFLATAVNKTLNVVFVLVFTHFQIRFITGKVLL